VFQSVVLSDRLIKRPQVSAASGKLKTLPDETKAILPIYSIVS